MYITRRWAFSSWGQITFFLWASHTPSWLRCSPLHFLLTVPPPLLPHFQFAQYAAVIWIMLISVSLIHPPEPFPADLCVWRSWEQMETKSHRNKKTIFFLIRREPRNVAVRSDGIKVPWLWRRGKRFNRVPSLQMKWEPSTSLPVGKRRRSQ